MAAPRRSRPSKKAARKTATARKPAGKGRATSRVTKKKSPKRATTAKPVVKRAAKKTVKSAGKTATKKSAKTVGKTKAKKASKTVAKKPRTKTVAKKSVVKKTPTKSGKVTKPAKPVAVKKRTAAVAKRPVTRKPLPAKVPTSRPIAKRAMPPPVKPLKKRVEASPPPPPPPPPPRVTLTVATRQSALAMAQTEIAIAYLKEHLPNHDFRILPLTTTGDRQAEWSLEQEGGKGLFVGELEAALLDGRADLAIHSAKDLPTELTSGLDLAGYLPREDPRDVLIIRHELPRPGSIATGSPRRRQQLQRQFVKSVFCEIRGNVETRLRKITEGLADATVLAAAGLNRLKISDAPGMRFQMLPLAVSVPAVGQGAIAVQTRPGITDTISAVLDYVTRVAVNLERAFLRRMGGGCHTAFAVHYDGIGVHLFHDACGYQRFAVTPQEALEPERVAARVLSGLDLNA